MNQDKDETVNNEEEVRIYPSPNYKIKLIEKKIHNNSYINVNYLF